MIKKVMTSAKVNRADRAEIKRAGRAEMKIAMVIIYYTLTGIVGLVAFTYFDLMVNTTSTISDHLGELFLCESTGTQDCSNVDLGTSNILKTISVIANVMITFSSLVVFLFSFNPKNFKKIKCLQKRQIT